MSVMQWMVEQLQKDSECCGNPFRCHWYERDKHPKFHRCTPEEE